MVTSARARPGETILLAEDEPAVRRGATRILERAGYRVLEVEDGLQAIDVYLRHAGEVSLVILDAVMPRMGGRRVYDELFAHRGPALRVLFCSGYAAEETDPELHLPAGCRYLAKPYHSSDLLSLVRAMLDDS